MATTTLGAESAHVIPVSIFGQRLSAYRMAKAELDLHYARGGPGYDEEYELEGSRLSDVHTTAMDILLMSAPKSQRDLAYKIEIIVNEKIHDGWHLADEIMAVLGCDAERLLDHRLPARA